MKNYKECEKQYIGCSDNASLILAGCDNKVGIKLQKLCFGEDGSYNAYIVTDTETTIGTHYKEIARFQTWMKIYDDTSLVRHFRAKEIVVYTAGMFGCVIQLIGIES